MDPDDGSRQARPVATAVLRLMNSTEDDEQEARATVGELLGGDEWLTDPGRRMTMTMALAAHGLAFARLFVVAQRQLTGLGASLVETDVDDEVRRRVDDLLEGVLLKGLTEEEP